MKETIKTWETADVAVIGTGIHGVHLATSLVESGTVPPARMVTIDPGEKPLALWNRRVHNCCMDYLRSPASHGLSPVFQALRSALNDEADSTPPYRRPSVDRFRAHCRRRVERFLAQVPRISGWVETIVGDVSPGERQPHHYRVMVRKVDGEPMVVRARAVIVCPGQPPPNIPPVLHPFSGEDAVGLPPTPVYHVHDTAFDPRRAGPGDRVLIVGGGIAAIHLALALTARSVFVTVWHRDPITVHQFDSDPCFIGPRCGYIFGSGMSDERRTELISRSRRPGSVPPDLFDRFQRVVAHGRCIREQRTVTTVRRAGSRLWVGGTGRSGGAESGTIPRGHGEFDQVVACTGFRDEPPAVNLIERTAHDLGLPLTGSGYPVLSEELAWAPGLYLSGGLADNVIGPPARNIIGAHLARRRIFPALEQFLNR